MSSDTPLAAQEKRRHQRIRFDDALPMKIGHHGARGKGQLENLSLGGLMFRSDLQLSVGEGIGCEFRVFESPLIDIAATIVSRIGAGLYGARFNAGPMSQHLIEGAINDAILNGQASVLTIHNLDGGKVMRIAGGLTSATKGDFLHGLTRVGITELDLSEVTRIDDEGVALCAHAVARYGVRAERRSSCVQAAWRHP